MYHFFEQASCKQMNLISLNEQALMILLPKLVYKAAKIFKFKENGMWIKFI